MSLQRWQESIAWTDSDGAAVANTVTETIIFPDVTVPANYMQYGRGLRLNAKGKLSVNTATTPTVRFRLRWGGVAGVLLWDSGLITNGSGVTNALWALEIFMQTRLNGATGTILAMGECLVGSAAAPSVGSATGAPAFGSYGSGGDDSPAAVTVNLTIDKALSLSVEWGTAHANNTLTGMIYHLESLN